MPNRSFHEATQLEDVGSEGAWVAVDVGTSLRMGLVLAIGDYPRLPEDLPLSAAIRTD